MYSLTPIWSILLRHARLWKRDINIVFMIFYWPLLDIIIWGFVGSWIQQSNSTQFINYEAAALLGVLLWQVVGRGANVMAFLFIEELWSNNVVNLFSLPLKIVDWILGIILCTAIAVTMTTVFCLLFIKLLYNVSVMYMLSTFFIFFPPLFLTMLWLGFTCLFVILLTGKRGAELGFVAAWSLMPFSGAYYPIDILPAWGQTISSFLPMSYVFQGMRGYVMHQQDPSPWLIKGYMMGFVYATCALALFIYCFQWRKHKGLARLSD